jgi:AAA15 family ATPase/GTPase
MITRIELDGFKTFKDFEVELGLFEVIVGANGSGKSNVFDALRLLSALIRLPLELDDVRQGMRGETP